MNMPLTPPAPAGRESFDENRAKHPGEALLAYANRVVAWQADGTRILADGATLDEVEERLRAAGVNPNQVVFEFIPGPDVSHL